MRISSRNGKTKAMSSTLAIRPGRSRPQRWTPTSTWKRRLVRAWNFGHVGDLFSRKAQVKSLQGEPYYLTSQITYDEDKLADFIASIHAVTDVEPVDAVVAAEADGPRVISESVTGSQLQEEETLELLNDLLIYASRGRTHCPAGGNHRTVFYHRRGAGEPGRKRSHRRLRDQRGRQFQEPQDQYLCGAVALQRHEGRPGRDGQLQRRGLGTHGRPTAIRRALNIRRARVPLASAAAPARPPRRSMARFCMPA